MTILNKILLTLYFILWTIFLGLLCIYFIDSDYTNKFYSAGRLFLPLISILTATVSLLTLFTLIVLYFFRPDKKQLNKKFIRAATLPFIGLIPFFILYLIPDKLEEKEETLELSYIAWACDCANWAKLDDIKKYNDAGDTLADLSVFIEPADKSYELPDTIGYNGDVIKLTGHFYTKKGFPKGYQSFEQPDRARVFQYTSYKIIKSNHHETQLYLDSLKRDE
ncbi:MAG: hypothetical protein KA501_05440 [Bacteroidia bacterium]|nr:hypothetical protein [Bacteroidia bacterium]